MRTKKTLPVFALLLVIVFSLAACGGGGGKSSPPPVQPPTITISTSTLSEATVNTAYSATVSSNCTGTCTWSVSSGALPNGLTMTGSSASASVSGTPTTAGTSSFTLRVTNGTSTATKSLSITVKDQPPTSITISTNSLGDATVNLGYSATVASNCTGTCTWSVSSGALPDGLTMTGNSASATISGTPTKTGTFPFTVQVTNGTLTATKDLSITVKEQTVQGRNDSIATATPLTSGTYTASISPYADVNGQANPDTDYYVLTATAGATVEIDVDAVNIGTVGAPLELMDPVIEIVNAAGQRFRTCKDPGNDDNVFSPIVVDTTPTAFDDECMNDDRGDDPTTPEYDHTTNSMLIFQPSGPAGSTQTFYIHVIDWRGDARPDIVYTIKVTGAN